MSGEATGVPPLPPGNFSPDAIELPKPKFLAAMSAESTAVPSAPGSESDEGMGEEDTMRQLQERLLHLRALQRQSLVKYIQYARQLQALQKSASGSAGSTMLLGTQPPSQMQVPSIAPTSSTAWAASNKSTVTLMVKGLPSYFTQDLLLSQLVAGGFGGSFDLLYVPYSHRGCLGYGLVNFTQPHYARQFEALADDILETSGLQVEAAPLQGYEENYYQLALRWSGQPPLSRFQLLASLGTFGTEARTSMAAQFGYFQ